MNSDLESLRKIKETLIQNGVYNRKEFYHEHYLKSDYWKNKREEIKEDYDFKCVLCKSNENLNVHHLSYENVDKLKEEDNKNLICLCRTCHENIHYWKDFLDRQLGKIKNTLFKDFVDYKNRARLFATQDYIEYLIGLINIFYPYYINICSYSFTQFIEDYSTKYFNKFKSYFFKGTVNGFLEDTDFINTSCLVINNIIKNTIYRSTSNHISTCIEHTNELINFYKNNYGCILDDSDELNGFIESINNSINGIFTPPIFELTTI